jgi:hypothetical protein
MSQKKFSAFRSVRNTMVKREQVKDIDLKFKTALKDLVPQPTKRYICFLLSILLELSIGQKLESE